MRATALRQVLKSFCSNSPWVYALLWKPGHWSPLTLTCEDSYCVYTEPIVSEENLSNDVLGGYSIGLLVDNLSHLQYTWDEGVIGKVAHTDNHYWISYDDTLGGNMEYSNLFDEFPEELQLQFMSGIKTIAHIPVLPHGVLQLGSLEMVPEDLEVISYIKERFMHHSAGENPNSFSEAQTTSPLMCTLMDNFNGSLSTSSCAVTSEDSSFLDTIEPKDTQLNLDWIMPNFDVITEEFLPEILRNYDQFGSGEEFSLLNQSIKESQPSGIVDFNQLKYLEEQLFWEDNINSDINLESLSSFFSFPKHSELHEALGSAGQGNDSEYLFGSYKSEQSALVGGIEPSPTISEGYAEYQLQSMVDNIHGGSGSDETSNEFSGVNSLVTSPSSGLDILATNQVLFSFATGGKNEMSAASSPLSSTTSTLTDKARKPTDVSKTKARRGESQKQRPRDRQLIQDRVKELRELVPNGEKSSIDGLLDQTVKHMLYLRSMMNQAEKLSQWVHQEVHGRKNLRSSLTKDDYQKGTSWGFDIGDDKSQVCPIVVEDLPYPGHLLIEMLCNEEGMFLEIAQIIRSFDLVILKGVMECSEKTWAHFIVEASRGFHRLDIFWPLMQLLQRRRKRSSSKVI